MFDYEAYIKLDNDIKHRPATFSGTTAEWNALTAAEKSYYEIVNLSDDSLDPEIVDPIPTQNSTHLVSSGGVWQYAHGIHASMVGASIEYTNIAMHPYAVGDYLIAYGNDGVGYFAKVIAAIAIGDTIANLVNIRWATISEELRKAPKRDLLWINPDSFMTPDTVTSLALSEYQELEIYFSYTENTAEMDIRTIDNLVGLIGRLVSIGLDAEHTSDVVHTINIVNRRFTILDNGIRWGAAEMLYNGEVYSTGTSFVNTRAVPRVIYGIKY